MVCGRIDSICVSAYASSRYGAGRVFPVNLDVNDVLNEAFHAAMMNTSNNETRESYAKKALALTAIAEAMITAEVDFITELDHTIDRW